MGQTLNRASAAAQELAGGALPDGIALAIVVCGFTAAVLALQRWLLPARPAGGGGAARAERRKLKRDADAPYAGYADEADSDGEGGLDLPFAPAEDDAPMIPNSTYTRVGVDEMRQRAASWLEKVTKRRSVRHFSEESFPVEIMHDICRAAGRAPSGANLQPWTYVIVKDPSLKGKLRDLVEREEEINYARRMSEAWKADLAHLGTNACKPYLEEAPYIVCIFKHSHRVGKEGEKLGIYYPEQSVGMSAGMFMLAVHNAGLATVTTTPMGAETAIRELLGRPANERLYLLMPVGYPIDGCQVPNITKKSSEELIVTM